MEANRKELSSILFSVQESCGEDPHLYFQPPEDVKLVYPCILYRLRTMTNDYADDRPYRNVIAYDITYITRSPVSKVPTELAKLPGFGFDRYYVSDNLHHYAYTASSTLKEESNG